MIVLILFCVALPVASLILVLTHPGKTTAQQWADARRRRET